MENHFSLIHMQALQLNQTQYDKSEAFTPLSLSLSTNEYVQMIYCNDSQWFMRSLC